VGIWTSGRQWSEVAGRSEAASELEKLGFAMLFIGGSIGQIPVIDTVLGSTTRLVAATGITQIWSNPAGEVAADYHRLNDVHAGRFVLGLGVGHAPAVEASGQQYLRPLDKLGSYLDQLDQADRPVPRSGRLIAALGPKALGITAQRAAGAHPYNVAPEHTARAREILGPSPVLIPEQKILFVRDPSVARRVGRQTMAIYLNLPNYLNNLRSVGFDDGDFADGGSDRLIDTMVAWGPPEAVAARVHQHLDAGADQVAVQVLSDGDSSVLPRQEWREAAETLLG
jgi:probable F420-dependent oxidoreductase